ncbi:MAG: M48 family metallopeptidase [Faecousia sp.]
MESRSTAYRVIRSSRKTISVQISGDGGVLVRCPRRMPDEAIRVFVDSKSDWIRKHLEKQAAMPRLPTFTDAQIRSLAEQASRIIPARAAWFAPLVGVTYGRITIRKQRSRWGSCSSKGNLNFNCLLVLTPPEVLDYVVVHELCHRKEMNHSGKFWAEVEQVLPDYKARQKWLKENGAALIRRLTG